MDFGLKGSTRDRDGSEPGHSATPGVRTGPRGLGPGGDEPRQACIEAAADTVHRRPAPGSRRWWPTSAAPAEPAATLTPPWRRSGRLDGGHKSPARPPAGETLAITAEPWQKAFEQNLLSFTRIVQAAAPEDGGGGLRPPARHRVSWSERPIPNWRSPTPCGRWWGWEALSRDWRRRHSRQRRPPRRIDAERIAELEGQRAEERRGAGRGAQSLGRGIPLGRSAGPKSSPTSSCSSPRRPAATSAAKR